MLYLELTQQVGQHLNNGNGREGIKQQFPEWARNISILPAGHGEIAVILQELNREVTILFPSSSASLFCPKGTLLEIDNPNVDGGFVYAKSPMSKDWAGVSTIPPNFPDEPDAYTMAQFESHEYPRLEALEQMVLLIRAKAGDPEAHERLFRSNMRLSWAMANRYNWSPYGACEFLDAVQVGYDGARKGIDAYRFSQTEAIIRWNKLPKVSTVMTWWIRSKIRNLFIKNSRQLLNTGTLHQLDRGAVLKVVSIDSRGNPVEGRDSLEKSIPSSAPDPLNKIVEADARTEFISCLEKALSHIPDGFEIALSYGDIAIDGRPPKSREELAKRAGRTPQAISDRWKNRVLPIVIEVLASRGFTNNIHQTSRPS